MSSNPFVFLPGTLCDERLWHHQTAVFKNAYVANLRTQDSLDAMVESVAQAPYGSFILAGFFMGGYVAQEFALRFPARVSKLVIIACSSEGYPPGEKEVVQRSIPMIEKGLFKGLTERRMREYLHPYSYQDAGIRELIQSMAGIDAAQVYLRQLKATLDRRSLSEEIGKVRCPISVIAGKDDKIVPAESILRMEKYAPRAEINILPECGHFVPLEKSERVNELMMEFARRDSK